MDDPPTLTDIANLFVAATALIVAVISGFYGWRAYAIQLTSSTPRGIQLMLGAVRRDVPHGGGKAMRVHRVIGVAARGPGVRYNATLVVWGDVEVQFLSKQKATWSADDVPLTGEMHGKASAFDEPVYFGVVWESPSFFRRRFTAHGYRVRLKWERGIQQDELEVWSDRSKSWKILPRRKAGKDASSNPVAGSSASGTSVMRQIEEQATDWDWS